MKKALYVATVVKMHIMEFHIPYLKMLKQAGWETSVAAKNDYEDRKDCMIPYCDTYYDVPFERLPFKFMNFKAYKELKKIIDEGGYDLIHCHTPVGALLARLAARKARKRGCKVIYTAHGFHFYKGAPLKNWLLYYPVEWFCSWMTDVLITINAEDYKRALGHFHARKIKYMPGVGIDLERFRAGSVDKKAKREMLGVSENDIMLISVGELSARKNHEVIIRALGKMDCTNIRYFICGEGQLKQYLLKLIQKMDLQGKVRLLGYRNDISELYQAADLCVFPSKSEGLPVALMEAISCKTPVICSRIRGNMDLVKNKECWFDESDENKVYEYLYKILVSKGHYKFAAEMKQTVERNLTNLSKYALKSVLERMGRIYEECLNGK